MAKIAYGLMVAAMVCSGFVRAADAVWTATPMSASGDTIRKDGELVFALAGGAARDTLGTITVNGVPFTTIFSLTDYPSSQYTLPFGMSPKIGYDASGLGEQGTTGDYAQMLSKGFWNNALGEYAFTLSGLEVGEKYLVQIVCHRDNATDYSVGAPGDGPVIKICGSGWTYGGTLVGEFTATDAIYTFKLNYMSSGTGVKAHFNAFQVRKLSGVVADPNVQSVGSSVSGTTATITLTGVSVGTDDEATPATSYAVSYLLDDAVDATAVESGLTAENYSFPIADLEDEMVHNCKVIVANDAGRATTNETSFLVNSLAPVFVPGWTGEPVDKDGIAIRKDGTPVWAWCGRDPTGLTSQEKDFPEEIEVNGVTFNALWSLGNHSSKFTVPFSMSPGMNMDASAGSLGGEVDSAVTDAGLREMLNFGWWNNNNGAYAFTLDGLTAGEMYLVQLVFRNGDSTQSIIAPDETTQIKQGGTGWTYGGTLVGKFKAEDQTHSFTITFSGGDTKARLNAIQVRQLSKNGRYVVSPVIGALSVSTTSSSARIGFPNIALGTDDDGFVAKSFTVAYRLNGADPVNVPGTFSGSAASFDIKDLAYGAYTCEVTITTDKGTVATQSVAFDIERDLPYDFGWTADPMDVNGDVICNDGKVVFAYAGVSNSTVNGVFFKGVKDNPASHNMPEVELFYGHCFWENPDTNADPAPAAVTNEEYANLLSHSFWAQSGDQTVVLKNLTVGQTYLFQLVSRSDLNYRQGKIYAPGSNTVCTVPSGDGFPYGSSLVYVFTADEESKTLVFNLDNAAHVNVVQLRKVKAPQPRPVKRGTVIIYR